MTSRATRVDDRRSAHSCALTDPCLQFLGASVLGLLLCLTTAAVGHAQGTTYTFTKIADTNTDAGLAGITCVAVNNRGTVIVTFAPAGSNFTQVWRGDGGPFTQVAPNVGNCASLNDLDEVAYIVSNPQVFQQSLVKNTNGAITPIATNSAYPYLDASSNSAYTPLNNNGNAAFVAGNWNAGVAPGIYVAPAGFWVVQDPTLHFFVGPASINDSDVVPFLASRPDNTSPNGARIGVYRGTAGPLIENGDATSAGTMGLTFSSRPVINNAGVVAFTGSTTGSSEVYTTLDGVSVALVGVGVLDRISINDAGAVAFRAGNSASEGLYTGRPGSINEKVISSGDPLDGSQFVSGLVWHESLNDGGQVAFFAFLADGRRGVYRADPVDTTPPVVTPPSAISIQATEPSGATGNASPALAAFLAGGTATDNVDPNPIRLSPQMAGSDVDNNTVFPVGTSTVTFRFADASQNIGTADSTVTVTPAQACAANVTSNVTIVSGPIQFSTRTGRYTQSVTLKVSSTTQIQGPVSFVLDNLPVGVTLLGVSGSTSCTTPTGSPYVNVNVGPDGVLTSTDRTGLKLTFQAPAGTSITYTPRILGGPDPR